MRPLDGITVVALEQAVSAPFCTRQLADYGARVIKVERPGDGGGDFARKYDGAVKGLSSYFVWLNRSKESVTLDIAQPAGREVLDRLLSRADVFVQNLGPGAAGAPRPRLDDALRTMPSAHRRRRLWLWRRRPDVRPQSLRPSRSSRERPAVGDWLSRDAVARWRVDRGHRRRDVRVFGNAHGALEREKTGRGTRVGVSMLDSLGEWMSQPMYFGKYSGAAPARTGASHPTIAPYGPHRAGDGRDVLFGIQNDREWTRFCAEVLGAPDLARDERFADNPQRVANRVELTRMIERGVREDDGRRCRATTRLGRDRERTA